MFFRNQKSNGWKEWEGGEGRNGGGALFKFSDGAHAQKYLPPSGWDQLTTSQKILTPTSQPLDPLSEIITPLS